MAAHLDFIRRESSKTLENVRFDLRRRTPAIITNNDALLAAGKEILPFIRAIREEKVIIKGSRLRVRRVFAVTADSGEYTLVGWVLDHDISHCMICQEKFTGVLTSGKHHCRSCGNVVCQHCSDNEAKIKQLRFDHAVRICDQCYWGQDEVDAVTNEPGQDMRTMNFNSSSSDDKRAINLWEYGHVQLHRVNPVFYIKARRTDKSIIFVNICTCEAVPLNLRWLHRVKQGIFTAQQKQQQQQQQHQLYDHNQVSIVSGNNNFISSNDTRISATTTAAFNNSNNSNSSDDSVRQIFHESLHGDRATAAAGSSVLYLLVGEKGVAATTATTAAATTAAAAANNSAATHAAAVAAVNAITATAADVYDVAVHPAVIDACRLPGASALLLTEVTEQVLMGISHAKQEQWVPFFSFLTADSTERPTTSPPSLLPQHATYKRRLKKQQKKSMAHLEAADGSNNNNNNNNNNNSNNGINRNSYNNSNNSNSNRSNRCDSKSNSKGKGYCDMSAQQQKEQQLLQKARSRSIRKSHQKSTVDQQNNKSNNSSSSNNSNRLKRSGSSLFAFLTSSTTTSSPADSPTAAAAASSNSVHSNNDASPNNNHISNNNNNNESNSDSSDSDSDNCGEEHVFKVDKSPPQLAVPAPVAFRHLWQVGSSLSDALQRPDDFSAAVHHEYNESTMQGQYMSMVHKIKQHRVPVQLQDASSVTSVATQQQQQQQQQQQHRHASISSGYSMIDGRIVLRDDYDGRLQRSTSGAVVHGFNNNNNNHSSSSSNNFGKRHNRKSLTFKPVPGFVLKTHRLRDGQEKVFINVTFHPSIDQLVQMNLIVPSTAAVAGATTTVAGGEAKGETTSAINTAAVAAAVEEHLLPVVLIGEGSFTTDKNNQRTAVYTVAVQAAFFKSSYRETEHKITNKAFIRKIIREVNRNFSESLSEEVYSFPRLRKSFAGAEEEPPKLMNFTFEGVEAPHFNRGITSATAATAGDCGSNRNSNSNRNKFDSIDGIFPMQQQKQQRRSIGQSDYRYSSSEYNRDSDERSVISELTADHSTMLVENYNNHRLTNSSGDHLGMPHLPEDAEFDEPEHLPDDIKELRQQQQLLGNKEQQQHSFRDFMRTQTPHQDALMYCDSDDDSNNSTMQLLCGVDNPLREFFQHAAGGGLSLISRFTGKQRQQQQQHNQHHNHQQHNKQQQQQQFAGRNELPVDGATFIAGLTISRTDSDELRQQSITSPAVLLGWQVVVLLKPNTLAVVAVITGVRKTSLKKSEYRISSFLMPDLWLRLKRSEQKDGVPFWPVRKVLFLTHRKLQL